MSAVMFFPNQPVAALVGVHRFKAARRRSQRLIDMPGACVEVADDAPQIGFDNQALPPPGFPGHVAFGARDNPADPPKYLVIIHRVPINRHRYRLIADMRSSNILSTTVMTCAEAE
jgi:hypothetical protein